MTAKLQGQGCARRLPAQPLTKMLRYRFPWSLSMLTRMTRASDPCCPGKEMWEPLRGKAKGREPARSGLRGSCRQWGWGLSGGSPTHPSTQVEPGDGQLGTHKPTSLPSQHIQTFTPCCKNKPTHDQQTRKAMFTHRESDAHSSKFTHMLLVVHPQFCQQYLGAGALGPWRGRGTAWRRVFGSRTRWRRPWGKTEGDTEPEVERLL